MPSPRAAYGRDYTAVSLQYDTSNRTREQSTAYQIARRSGQRRPSGHPVTVRNGLPDFKPYRYQGTGHDIDCGYPESRCTCHA